MPLARGATGIHARWHVINLNNGPFCHGFRRDTSLVELERVHTARAPAHRRDTVRYLLPPASVGPEVVTMLTVFVALALALSVMRRGEWEHLA